MPHLGVRVEALNAVALLLPVRHMLLVQLNCLAASYQPARQDRILSPLLVMLLHFSAVMLTCIFGEGIAVKALG